MTALTRAAILGANDMHREQVEVPEWGGYLYVATMTGAARDAYEASIITLDGTGRARQNLENIRAKLVAACAVDEQGERLFSDADALALGKKSAAALDRVFSVASRLNAVTEDDVRDLAKNS